MCLCVRVSVCVPLQQSHSSRFISVVCISSTLTLHFSHSVLADAHDLHIFANCAAAPARTAFKGSRRLSVSQPPEKDSIIQLWRFSFWNPDVLLRLVPPCIMSTVLLSERRQFAKYDKLILNGDAVKLCDVMKTVESRSFISAVFTGLSSVAMLSSCNPHQVAAVHNVSIALPDSSSGSCAPSWGCMCDRTTPGPGTETPRCLCATT